MKRVRYTLRSEPFILVFDYLRRIFGVWLSGRLPE